MNAEELETIIRSKIEKSLSVSPDETVLGFIEVDDSIQMEILKLLRLENSLGSISGLLRSHPALTVYGLAVAAPIGLSDEDVANGGFYSAWESAFGYTPGVAVREPLAKAFVAALNALGLPVGTISPEKGMHWHGGCYLFHSAILPHFVQPLKVALKQARERRPLPDPEDDDQCRSFANYLADCVSPAQQRLQKVLHSPVGFFLVKRLVWWALTRDNNLFPPHVRDLFPPEPLGPGVYARSPFICFDETQGVMQLVLPAQGKGLADPKTRWTVAGCPAFRALDERPPINLSDLDISDGKIHISLSHLKDNRDSIEYELSAGLPKTMPFRVFESGTGKERKVYYTGDSIELPPGQQYLVLLADDTGVVGDHEILTEGESRFIRVAIEAGVEPIKLANAMRVWKIKPRVKPGLYLFRDEATTFQACRLNDDRTIAVSYGDIFGMTLCIPADADVESVTFSTAFDDSLTLVSPIPKGEVRDGMRMVDLSELLNQWKNTLPPAVHLAKASVRLPSRLLEHEWHYWKGLNRITIYGDLKWSNAPENLRDHSGFKKNAKGMIREQKNGGTAIIELSNLGKLANERWEIPANRVDVSLLSEDGSIQDVLQGSKLEIIPGDKRAILFRSGGLMPVRLTANGRFIGEITIEKPTLCKYLSALTAEFGKTASLHAETVIPVPGENSWHVLSWQTPLTAKEIITPEVRGEILTWTVRHVMLRGISGLRAVFSNIKERFSGIAAEEAIVLQIPAVGDPESITEVQQGLTVHTRRTSEQYADVDFKLIRSEQTGNVWTASLECMLEDSESWQEIYSKEAHGKLALVRLILVGTDPEDNTAFGDLFWGGVKRPLSSESPVFSMDVHALATALDEAELLISCKYATPVWKQNAGRLKALGACLSLSAERTKESGLSVWWPRAIRSLAGHAQQTQPVVIPELLFVRGIELASTSLTHCHFGQISSEDLVSRSFLEAASYENRTTGGALEYVSQAFQEFRVDPTFFNHFSNITKLKNGEDVALGRLHIKDWSDHLYQGCRDKSLEIDDNQFPLLAPDHFIRCLAKAKRRALVLNSVANQEGGHWLGKPLLRLKTAEAEIQLAIRELLGPYLSGVPIEVLWRPYAESTLAHEDENVSQTLHQIMAGTCLVALALRSRAKGNLKDSPILLQYLRRILGQGNHHEGEFHDQMGLIIGTAPELFAFYFLLFTLCL